MLKRFLFYYSKILSFFCNFFRRHQFFQAKKLRSYKLQANKGFSLLEIIFAIGIFLLFAVGIYSGLEYVFKSVYQSRVRIVESGILDEQMEIVHNLAFQDVGIILGSPVGVLARTVTTTRSGINFTITRTIRNVDDPFDGTIGGAPNDTSPADYKLVQVDVVCVACLQHRSVSSQTTVSPRYLEGDPTHGALFIEVFDAAAVPVQGAEVHVVATSTNPAIDLIDTTDNDGMLRLVDLPAGARAYHITVTKNGYTTDATIIPDVTNPNPTKPPVSVAAQNLTEVSFSIDLVSTMPISTLGTLCTSIPSVGISMIGTRLLGLDPDVFLLNQSVTTDAAGLYTVTNVPWDTYAVRPTGYDLQGSIPQLSVSLAPGVTQPLQLILGANSANSLLVTVRDSITGQPVSNATVTVTSTGYSVNKSTGVGFIRQTDWSGGRLQSFMVNENQYWTDDGMEILNPAGDLSLLEANGNYLFSGFLESSTFDLGLNPTYVNLVWEPLAQPSAAGSDALRFQLATSITSSTSWDYKGPDGTITTYYDATNPVVWGGHIGERYVRYKVYLATASSTVTPILSDLSITYTNSCTPPGQAYFGSLGNQEYNVTISKTGYQIKNETLTVSGDIILAVDLVAS